ncbi:hypothetical protein ACG93T_12005 [Acinetobacter beijerinckii]|uniref:hypothetical protein n=1 Tax=Acinetobacter beijerinckii TaxID=262668 RepID=UPI003AF682BB
MPATNKPIINTDDEAICKGLYNFLSQQSILFGNIDVFFMGCSRSINHLKIIVSLLGRFKKKDNTSCFESVILVIPPVLSLELDLEKLYNDCEILINSRFKFNQELPLSERFKIVLPNDMKISTLLSLIQDSPTNSIVIVHNAVLYRSDALENQENVPVLFEDLWVPHLTDLVFKIAKLLENKEIYIILNAGEKPTFHQTFNEQTKNIKNLAVLGIKRENDAEDILKENINSWTKFLAQGRLGQALKCIEDLPESFEIEKKIQKIQVLFNAGLTQLAVNEIESLDFNDSIYDASGFIKLAQITNSEGSDLLTVKLLNKALDGLKTKEELELALSISESIENTELQTSIASKLLKFYPDSVKFKIHQINLFLEKQEYCEAAKLIDHNFFPKIKEFYEYLRVLQNTSLIPNYIEILEYWIGYEPSLAARLKIILIKDALAKKMFFHVIKIILFQLPSREISVQQIHLFITVLEQLILNQKKPNDFHFFKSELQQIFEEIVIFLSKKPNEKAVFIRFCELLQPDKYGVFGIALLTIVIMNFLSKNPVVLGPLIEYESLSVEDFFSKKTFLKNISDWLIQEAPLILGEIKLPTSLITEPPDIMVQTIAEILSNMAKGLDQVADVETIRNLLNIGVSIAPFSSNPNMDLSMIRTVASGLSLIGKVQYARDMVEQTLRITDGNIIRSKMAWFSMADVYNRTHDDIRSLVSCACAILAHTQDALDPKEVYSNIQILARVFRNLGFLSEAKKLNEKGKKILERIGLFSENEHQYEYFNFSVDVLELERQPNEEFFLKLIENVSSNAIKVQSNRDHLAPIILMLAQLIREGEELGYNISPDIYQIYNSLSQEGTSIYLETYGKEHLSSVDVFKLYNHIDATRYSTDVSYDLRRIVYIAKRLLSSREAREDIATAVYALELLTDRSIATPGWQTIAEPVPKISSIREPIDFLINLSKKNITILLIGLDSKKQLTSVVVRNGQSLYDQTVCFSFDQFENWKKNFPYEYGIDDGETSNLFYTSMNFLEISNFPDSRLLVIPSADLAPIPPNILMIDNELAGRTKAVAIAPSSSWLSYSLQNPLKTNGRFVSWISRDDSIQTSLPVMIERLSPTLEQYNITLNTEPTLPLGFSNSELVIIGAHGGISSEEHLFQRISDDGFLKISADEFCEKFRNIGVVILFVCSGGRSDLHPAVNTNIGLAKKMLDRGCSTVIASPWPLDIKMTYKWLPIFLEHWTNGVQLIDATYLANQAVSEAFSHDPSYCLAMSVFGDPFRVFKP